MRVESNRIYLDEKQMATSGGLMQKVVPEIFDPINQAGNIEGLLNAENTIKDKCTKLNDIQAVQYFLPTNLRS